MVENMREYIGVPLYWEELKSLAIFHRKLDIVAKMDSLDPGEYDLFFSDGCSMWPDDWRRGKLNLSGACFWHDLRYFLGGTEQERRAADRELYADIHMIAGVFMAMTMYAGVRAGGWIHGTGFEWGYGRLSKPYRTFSR